MKINLKNSLIILFIVVAFIVIMPNMVNGATTINATETSTTSTGKTVSWTYSLNSNNEIQNLVCSNVDSVSGAVTIPKTIDGHKVVGLGYNAFRNCSGLTGITFNANITSIDEYAFYKCTGIQSIDLSTSNVTKINDYTFEDCSGIKTLNLGQNITYIGRRAFSNCSGITSLVLPNSITTIGEHSFSNCSGIKTLTLSNNLTMLPTSCFYNCLGITSVILPNTITTLSGSNQWLGARLFSKLQKFKENTNTKFCCLNK